MDFMSDYFDAAVESLSNLNFNLITSYVDILSQLRNKGGRVFVLGMGGSAANASHMVNDLRKICGIEAYAPTDNVSSFSASCNDEGLGTYFPGWLVTSKLSRQDIIFVLSVGGGSQKESISMEIVNALKTAKITGAKVLGIVGRDGGETLKHSKNVILVPTKIAQFETPLVESFQALIWHAIVFHPNLKLNLSKWESVSR